MRANAGGCYNTRMTTKYVIVAEDNGGVVFASRFFFDDRAEAVSAFTKLANISAATYNLATLEDRRRAPEPIHSNRLAAALDVLHEMDPDGQATTVYRLHEVKSFTQPSTAPATSELQAVFRAVRDLQS